MYGLCVDGDLHEIKPEYRKYATEEKSILKSHIFDKAIIQETDIQPEKFMILPPVACPATDILPFENQCESQKKLWKRLKEKLPVSEIIPYGENDSRTAIEFLYSFENHIDRRIETKIDSKYCFYDLIKQLLPYELHEVTYLEYEDLRDGFLNRYWNIENQFKVFSEFLKTSHPMYHGQLVSEYVYYWVNRLKRNGIILTQDFVKKLINRVPIRYGFHLTRHNRGAEWSEICRTVENCESDLIDIDRSRKQGRKDGQQCTHSTEF